MSIERTEAERDALIAYTRIDYLSDADYRFSKVLEAALLDAEQVEDDEARGITAGERRQWVRDLRDGGAA